MHDRDIVHRDIKPENIVISNVFLSIFREYINFVILDGQQSVKIEDQHIAEHLIMLHHKFLRENNMIKKLIYGVLEY